ncbi:hypothetical protein J3454_15195 [Erythrobacter sp. NFXS35]|uniref:hypothetical protein n=1 Tax=Erythrobacter sp. NFXS35 TaxID=2818436 RepID=UPI0032DFEEC0
MSPAEKVEPFVLAPDQEQRIGGVVAAQIRGDTADNRGASRHRQFGADIGRCEIERQVIVRRLPRLRSAAIDVRGEDLADEPDACRKSVGIAQRIAVEVEPVPAPTPSPNRQGPLTNDVSAVTMAVRRGQPRRLRIR